jgi:HSP20 family molecular chaperone IbpA
MNFSTVLVILNLFIFSNVGFTQNHNQASSEREKMMEEFMKGRKQMMDKMLDAFGKDDFFADDMNDDFFKSILGDRFKKLRSGFEPRANLVSINEIKNSDGTIDIFIKPKDKSVQLDIETKDQMIIIKGKQLEKIETTNNERSSTSMSQSSFSNSVQIPFGYRAGNPEAEGDKVKITLSPKKLNPGGKIPIQKRSGEDTL